jgi:hypothetical protein
MRPTRGGSRPLHRLRSVSSGVLAANKAAPT